MPQHIDLDQIEKRAYLAFHQDGLWDLCIGLAMIAMGVVVMGQYQEWMGIAALLPVFVVITVPALRRVITLPRLGYVEFSQARKTRQRASQAALMVIGTLIAMLGLVVASGYSGEGSWQRFIRGLELLPIGLVLLLATLAVGIAFGLKRCYAYTAAFAMLFMLPELLGLHPFLALAAAGLVLTATGIVLLVNFLHRYPQPPRETAGGH